MYRNTGISQYCEKILQYIAIRLSCIVTPLQYTPSLSPNCHGIKYRWYDTGVEINTGQLARGQWISCWASRI